MRDRTEVDDRDTTEVEAPAESRPLAYSDRDLDALGIASRKTRWRLRRAGKFPEPVEAGGRKLYRAADVHEWLRDPKAWAEKQRERGSGDGRAA